MTDHAFMFDSISATNVKCGMGHEWAVQEFSEGA